MTFNPRGCSRWTTCRLGCPEPYCEGCTEFDSMKDAEKRSAQRELRILRTRTAIQEPLPRLVCNMGEDEESDKPNRSKGVRPCSR